VASRSPTHVTTLIIVLCSSRARPRLRYGAKARLDGAQLDLGGDQRNHHLGHDRLAGTLGGLGRRLEDSTRLHLGDLGIRQREPAAAKAEHRAELVEFAGAVSELPGIRSHGSRDLRDLLLA